MIYEKTSSSDLEYMQWYYSVSELLQFMYEFKTYEDKKWIEVQIVEEISYIINEVNLYAISTSK